MASSDSSDYEEMETEVANIPCVFCAELQPDEQVFMRHCQERHAVNLFDIFGKMGDVFHVIKAINYLRQTQPAADEFVRLATEGPPHPWDAEEFLQPVIPNDPLLLVDFEPAFAHHHTHYHARSLPPDDVGVLREQLFAAYERIAQMQKTARALINVNEAGHRNGRASPDLAVASLKVSDDTTYIDSYSHFGIHQEMLQDRIRTESYRMAIEQNSGLIEGRNCLDVGCGTGILSMFLAREGKAALVTGVDFSDIIYSAMDIVRENELESVVHLKKGKLEELHELGVVDVIVSEWMGYFLLFESMIDTVITARDRLLKPGGILLPNKAHLYLTVSDDPELAERHVTYWHNVYGFKMTCFKKPCLREALIQTCRPESICGTSELIKHFDLSTVTVEETMSFTSPFEIVVKRTTNVTGIVGYFDTLFDLPSQKLLTTSPCEPATHWKQTIFLLPEARSVQANESLCGTISVRRSAKNRRGLDVDIQLKNEPVFKYVL